MNRPKWTRWVWWKGHPGAIRGRWERTKLKAWLARPWKRPTWARWEWLSAKPPLCWILWGLKASGIIWSWIGANFGYIATRSWWSTWYHHPDLDNPKEDEGHHEAEIWVLAYTPGRSNDEDVYSSALKYAERQYDQAVKINEALDKKLDDLWRNASTIGTILAAAAKFFPMTASLASSPVMVAALIFLALTVILSAYTRGPASMAVPTATSSILDVIESNPPPTKAQVEGVEAASYHYATVGMSRVNIWKSLQTKRATIFFCAGLFLLVLAMLFAGPQTPNLSSP